MTDQAERLVFVIAQDDWPKYINQIAVYFGYEAVDYAEVVNPETKEDFVIRSISEWMVDIVKQGERQDAIDVLNISPIVIGVE